MEYRIKINEFEGPLDLLLHLIKESNVDIYDIKLEEITKQYLDYIKAMEELNLSIASEYLVMAAELIEMKSRSLLPRHDENNTDEYEEDSKENLIKRLIDYKHYKEITGQFKEWESDRQAFFTKLPSDIKEYSDNAAIKNNGDVSLADLIDAFQKFLERKESQKPLKTKITVKELSIKDRSEAIRNILKTKQKVMFEELFEVLTKEYVVVTFLSILEMAKKQELIIKQDYHFDKIYLELRGSV